MQQATGLPTRSRLGGIRLYLVRLALLVALPLALLSIVRIAAERANVRHESEREVMRMARLVAARVDERMRTADALLLGLSADLSITQQSRAHADSVLARTLRISKGRYANVFLIDTAGTLVKSAFVIPAGMDSVRALADRSYFLRAQASNEFVVSEPMKSRLRDRAWIVVLARSLRSENNRFLGVVGISILLDSLSDVVSTADLPGAPLVTVVDTGGMVVARSKDAAQFFGVRRLAVDSLADTTSFRRLKDYEGNMRVSGYTRPVTVPWIVNVGMLQAQTASAARTGLINDVLLFLLTASIAVMVAYVMSQRIVRPVVRLTEDAGALARGLTGHRAVADGPNEIRALGEAFNQMAETVERRNASLADSERRYRFLFDSNPLPMWAWDADTLALLAVNEAAIDHYGYDRDTFLGLQITELLDPSEHARFSSMRLPFLESRQDAGTWKHRRRDGTIIEMEVVTTSSRRLGRASWLSVGIDVTARRAAERALANSEEQLRQSQKMEAVGAFAGGIAHDFNNLLTGMLGYCDLALGSMETSTDAYADIEEIRALAVRGADLTRQILTVSRKQVMQPAYLDANEVVRGLHRLLRRVVGEHIALETDLTDDLGSVFADAAQLEQTLLNLAANARDAMPDGGTLRITTRRLSRREAEVYALAADQSWIAISVQDTGVGMTPEVAERIFEPFYTTKERGKGTGLGLALAYGMMEQAGGALRVHSTVGAGSTFDLMLPRHTRPVSAATQTANSLAGLRGTETILVAEDEDSVRAVLTATLSSRGYNVLAAPSGEAALELSRQYPHRIDLLLTDVVMPGMNGRELAELIVRERADTAVLFASGYTDDASLLHGIRTDELSFLQKPFSPADVVRRVRSLLDIAARTT